MKNVWHIMYTYYTCINAISYTISELVTWAMDYAHRHGTHPDSHVPVPASPGAFNGCLKENLKDRSDGIFPMVPQDNCLRQ